MLNREKFAKEIMDIALEHTTLAITADGKICGCRDISCFDCKFYKTVNCRTAFKDWLDSEYKEPGIDWENVPVDTPVLVRNNTADLFHRRYFCGYFKGKDPYVTFEAGMTSWTAYGNGQSTSRWKYCKLVREEDKLKYAKGVEC